MQLVLHHTLGHLERNVAHRLVQCQVFLRGNIDQECTDLHCTALRIYNYLIVFRGFFAKVHILLEFDSFEVPFVVPLMLDC